MRWYGISWIIVLIVGGLLGSSCAAPDAPSPTIEPQLSTVTVEPVMYTNLAYGFRLKLPTSWRSYTVQQGMWQARSGSDPDAGVVAQGSVFTIWHPLSTEQEPRQPIPLMIFTHEQWARVLNDWSVSAAPVPPGKLAQNAQYVIALPARYNYSAVAGQQEVIQFLEQQPVEVFKPARSS